MRFDYSYYRRLLETLLEGRRSLTFPQRHAVSAPRFIMRHDIDFGLEFLGEMPAIESGLGVMATYFIQVASAFYNPLALEQATKIEELLQAGHRIGLHFDCRNDEEQRYLERLEWEHALLATNFGPVDAVSFHHPSPAVIENRIKIPYINTYDQGDMAGFVYFSDSCQRWSKGDPLQLVTGQPVTSFHVLVHPALWTADGRDFSAVSFGSIETKSRHLTEYIIANSRLTVT